MNRARRDFLLSLLAQPTAPFREQHVAALVTTVLDDNNVPWFRDPAGNLVVGCRSPAEYRQTLNRRASEPLRILIAHMDHPGFHGTRWLSPTRLRVRWHRNTCISTTSRDCSRFVAP